MFFSGTLVIITIITNQAQTIRINELMPENHTIIKDCDGDFSDWIEIYNPTSDSVNLTNWSLTDDYIHPDKWKFPEVWIASKSYLLIFASEKNYSVAGKELHTNFKLNTEGDFLGLYDPFQNAVNVFSPSYPELQPDLSYAFNVNGYITSIIPTPGTENRFEDQQYLLPPVFSHKHGFYNTPLKIGITSDNANSIIKYTTDGSEPSLNNGIQYTDSIYIGTTAVIRAVVIQTEKAKSKIVSQTYIFIQDVIKQPNNPVGYPSEWGPYTAMPGIAIADYEMDTEVVSDSRYKNDFEEVFLSIPIMSIVTDINNLFSKSTNADSGGIYIYTGAPENDDEPGLGDGWERPASVEYFDNEGLHDFTIDCGLRLHGGHSRRAEKTPKHSFRILFKDKYGAPELNYPIFGETGNVAQSFTNLILRAGYGNTWLHMSSGERSKHQLIRDLWAKDAQLEMGNLSGHGNFVHLFLNGLYWGIYNPTERIDKNFASTYLGGDGKDFDIIKDYATVVDGNDIAWFEMLEMARPGLSDNIIYQRLQGKNPDGTINPDYPAYLDVENFIDYMLLNFYGSNWDWDHHNWVALRNRKTPGKGFVFFSWDAEHIIEDVYMNVLYNNNTDCPSELFQLLLKNEDFRRLFAERVEMHCFNNGVLTPEACKQRWVKRAGEIDMAIIAESARWGDYRKDVHQISSAPFELYTKLHWLEEQSFVLNEYFPERTDEFINQLNKAGLYPYIPETPVIYSNTDNVLTASLYQNYPNPFGSYTFVSYYISCPADVILKIVDAFGKNVDIITNEFQNTGYYKVKIETAGYPDGIYYCVLITDKEIPKTIKMIHFNRK